MVLEGHRLGQSDQGDVVPEVGGIVRRVDVPFGVEINVGMIQFLILHNPARSA